MKTWNEMRKQDKNGFHLVHEVMQNITNYYRDEISYPDKPDYWYDVYFKGTAEEFLKSLIEYCDSYMATHHYATEEFLYCMESMFVNDLENEMRRLQTSTFSEDEEYKHTYQNMMDHYEDIKDMAALICEYYRSKIIEQKSQN